jgi:hypothetical protein
MWPPSHAVQFDYCQRGYLDADVEDDSLMNAAQLLERWERTWELRPNQEPLDPDEKILSSS